VKGPSPAFQFYPKDWIVDTARFSLEEQGAFIRLLSHEWVEGPLPDSPTALARIVSLSTARFRTVWKHIGPLFAVVEGHLVNARLEDERAKQVAYRAEQSVRGQHGAAKRWSMAPAMPAPCPAPMAEASSKQWRSDSFPSPIPTTNKDRSFSRKASTASRTEKRSPMHVGDVLNGVQLPEAS
jgi:uncharacterized protein YdaU (DUF1376 family)